MYVLFLILQQIFLILNGQTWHEYGKNIQIYNREKNFQSKFDVVFGKRWFFILFSPLVSSPPLGDGMSFDMNMTETSDNTRIGTKRM